MNYTIGRQKQDPRRIWWAEEDSERLNRSEYSTLFSMLTAVNFAAKVKKGLSKRLQSVPHGAERLNMALGGLKAVCDDIVGTVPSKQAQQMQNTFSDNVWQLVPKLSPGSHNVVMDADIADELIAAAKEKCTECVLNDEDCRTCQLYQVLTAIAPLEEYGSGMLCPYSKITNKGV